MTNLIVGYLAFGLGVYTSAAILRLYLIKDAKIKDIILGLILGIFLWPVALVVLWNSIYPIRK